MITIVIGKPGSGKSYDTVRQLLRVLENDVKRGEIRRIYTNLSLNVTAINAFLTAKLSRKVDITSAVTILNDDDFKFRDDLVTEDDYITQGSGKSQKKRIADTCKGYWWNRFEDDSLIIVDEIQKYLHNSNKETTSATIAISMYFSTHRHHRHEIILITQALTSLSTEVRKYAEQVKEVFNSKSMTLPFPFNISGRDLDVLRAGLGVTSQVYRVKTGILTPSNNYRPQYEGDVEVIKTDPKIYACYSTHTKKVGASSTDVDLPFKVDRFVKWRAIAWFLKKNSFNFGWKIAALIFLALFARFFFFEFCPALADNFMVQSPTTKTTNNESFFSRRSAVLLPVLDSGRSSEQLRQTPLDFSTVNCYSENGVVFGDKYIKVGEILPNGARLKSVDVAKGKFDSENAQNYYRANYRFLCNCRVFLASLDENAP